jgi:pyridinium-3,5-biscarboxylic acid mononucleotide synthase
MVARDVLEALASGAIDVERALAQLSAAPFRDVGVATVDAHRELRQGAPEVIFGEGKTAEQIVTIARALLDSGQNVLVSRIDKQRAAVLAEEFELTRYAEAARVARIEPRGVPTRGIREPVIVVTGGTSDIPVAEEACETLIALGHNPDRMFDVGVAGIHRLLHQVERLHAAVAVIAIAGMEGALPSVVGGIVACPVIAVPTSVGYGTALGGLTPLFAMLTSCASGITVVNIDNGFGAALAVHRYLMGLERTKRGA